MGDQNVHTFSNDNILDGHNYTICTAQNDEIFHADQTKRANSNVPEVKICGTKGIESGLFIRAKIHDKPLLLLIDSGADVTIISSSFFKSLDCGQSLKAEPVQLNLVSATGDRIPFIGKLDIPIELDKKPYTHKVLIADINFDGILGLDFMTNYSCDILVQRMLLRIKGADVLLIRRSDNDHGDLDTYC